MDSRTAIAGSHAQPAARGAIAATNVGWNFPVTSIVEEGVDARVTQQVSFEGAALKPGFDGQQPWPSAFVCDGQRQGPIVARTTAIDRLAAPTKRPTLAANRAPLDPRITRMRDANFVPARREPGRVLSS